MKFHLSPCSSNRKTGKIPVSTSSRETCPSSCPFREKGCYGNGGPLKLHWDLVTARSRGEDWQDFLTSISKLPPGQVWRHNQAGDLVGRDDWLDGLKGSELATANKGKRGFTYTHYPIEGLERKPSYNRNVIKTMSLKGFTVNLSANDLAHADRLAEYNLAPVTTMLPSNFKGRSFRTPAGRKGIVCPAVTRENMTCEKCKLCAEPLDKRSYIIGFPGHGSQKKWINEYLEGDPEGDDY